jgi:hypothetical protein
MNRTRTPRRNLIVRTKSEFRKASRSSENKKNEGREEQEQHRPRKSDKQRRRTAPEVSNSPRRKTNGGPCYLMKYIASVLLSLELS